MEKNRLRETRKQMLPLVTAFSPRDSLSKLSSPLGLPKEFFLLLRQYEEEMLDAFLTEDDYFPELLRSQDLLKTRDARISGRAERGMSDLRSSLATSSMSICP